MSNAGLLKSGVQQRLGTAKARKRAKPMEQEALALDAQPK
jgi:hypothetical protein